MVSPSDIESSSLDRQEARLRFITVLIHTVKFENIGRQPQRQNEFAVINLTLESLVQCVLGNANAWIAISSWNSGAF